jgi:Glycosyl transferase family 2
MIRTSIFIPSFNQEKFLHDSVGSALDQAGVDEILISDDKSTDSSLIVLSEFQKLSDRVIILSQEKNCGIPENIDIGMRKTAGDFVLRLDADDRLLPGACECLVNALERNPKAGTAHGQVWEISESGTRVSQRFLARPPGFQDATTALLEASRGYRVAANIIMFRREALDSVNYLQGRPSFAEDYHLYVDLAAKGWGNVYVDSVVGEYRNYTNTTRASRKAQELAGLIAVFQDVLQPAFQLMGLPLSQLDSGRRSLAKAQAFYLLHAADLSDAHKSELLRLLNILHTTPWPGLYLTARRLGMAPALIAIQRLRLAVRRQLKSLVVGARHAITPPVR